MKTITLTIPITKESLAFIQKALGEAQALGFPVEEYTKQIELASVEFEIADKEAELVELNKLKTELGK